MHFYDTVSGSAETISGMALAEGHTSETRSSTNAANGSGTSVRHGHTGVYVGYRRGNSQRADHSWRSRWFCHSVGYTRGGHNNNYRGPVSDWLPHRCDLQWTRPPAVVLGDGSIDCQQPTNR